MKLKSFDGTEGMLWWNSIPVSERRMWLTVANSACPADAWNARLLSAQGWNSELSDKSLSSIAGVHDDSR